MTIRERMEAFWSGERPDQIPYTTYHWMSGDKDKEAWQALFDAGLGATYHLGTVKSTTKNVEYANETSERNGKRVDRSIMRTPVGEVWSTRENGWPQDYLLKTPEDYRVMTYIVEHTELQPCYDDYLAREKALPPHGIPLVSTGRTPIQHILVDYAGLSNFGMHLFDFEDAVMTLYEAMRKQCRRRYEIVAGGPGRFVSILENFSADTLGPKRFEQFILPVYEEIMPMLHQAGKIAGTHYDGLLDSCRGLIARSPVDLIESLTAPPEGDMPLDEARAAWPDKLFWANINVSLYLLAPKQLRKAALKLVEQGAVDGRLLAFEISEDLPRNWKESVPVVLEALRETRG
jgi:hypothetical protein